MAHSKPPRPDGSRDRWPTALTSIEPNRILVRGYRLDEMMGRLGFGEAVYLLSGDAASTNLTGYSHGYPFGAAPSGVPFGRHIISTGDDANNRSLAVSIGNTEGGGVDITLQYSAGT